MVVIIFKHSMLLLLTFSAVVLFNQPMVLSLTFSMVVILFSHLGGGGYYSPSPRWWFYLDGSITDLLDSDGFAVQLALVETLDALVRLHHRWHGNEAEALGAGTLGVRDDLRSNNLRVGSYNLNGIRLFLLYLYVRGYSNVVDI